MVRQALPKTWLEKVAILALGLFGLVIFLGKSEFTSISSLDGLIFSHVALKVSEDGIKPKLPMRTSNYLGWNHSNPEPYFNDHPFPQLYIGGKLMRALGPSTFSSKLLSGLFAVATAIVLVFIGQALVSLEVGLVAGFVLLLTRQYVLRERGFVLDSGMIFFIMLSFLFWIQKRPGLMALAAGMGVWMKAPVSLLVFPVAALYWMSKGELKKHWRELAWSSALALAIGSLVWIATGMLGGWELIGDWARRHLLGTLEGRGVTGPDFISVFIEIGTTYWPWLLFFAWGLWRSPKRLREPLFVISGCAILIVYFVMSSMRFRYLYYYLPIYPFLALMLAGLWSDKLARARDWVFKGMIVLAMVFPVFVVATPISVSPEKHPGLRKHSAIIQSFAACDDVIEMIPGNEPYGGTVNFKYFLNFYTERKLEFSRCGQAMGPKTHWLIVSGDHFKTCVTEQTRKRLPVTFLYSNMYLLTDRIQEAGFIDLNFLTRELRPPQGCQPAHIESDRYYKPEFYWKPTFQGLGSS